MYKISSAHNKLCAISEGRENGEALVKSHHALNYPSPFPQGEGICSTNPSIIPAKGGI